MFAAEIAGLPVLETIVFAALSLTAASGAIRIIIGPSLADRVAALDVMLIALMSAIAADAGFRQDTSGLPLLVVIAIVGFTATVAASRFIEHEAGKGTSTIPLERAAPTKSAAPPEKDAS